MSKEKEKRGRKKERERLTCNSYAIRSISDFPRWKNQTEEREKEKEGRREREKEKERKKKEPYERVARAGSLVLIDRSIAIRTSRQRDANTDGVQTSDRQKRTTDTEFLCSRLESSPTSTVKHEERRIRSSVTNETALLEKKRQVNTSDKI